VSDEIIEPKRKLGSLLKQSPTAHFKGLPINERELEVLLRLRWTKEETARHLNMKVRTVEKHEQSIYLKLGASTRAEALLNAAQLGYELFPYREG
jgi:DNA-binding NarL/FixJ family response regulator